MALLEGNLHTQRHEICSQECRDCRLSYAKTRESLSHLGVNRYLVMTERQKQTDGRTDGRTNRITVVNARLAVPAVARKKAYKK